MESTINRKDYRRNAYSNYEKIEKVKTSPKESLFLSKIINAMLILLAVLLLKLFNFDDAFNFIKENFNSGIPFEIIEEKVKQKFNFNVNSFDSYDESGELTESSGDDSNQSGENTYNNGEMINSSGEQYLEAVAGVNQFMEDSKEIKEKYNIQNPLKGTITSTFGCRVSDNPIVSSYHTGLDIAANTGTIIVAAHDGKVIQAGTNGSYGKSVTIENGGLVTLYAHCSEILVKMGDTVKVGQNIGKVGMTGNATGPHLHLEVRYDGRFVNPEDVI